MSHVSKFLLGLVALILVVTLVLPAVVPSSAYRTQVEDAAQSALNRTVTLNGDLSFSLLPRVEVQAANVRIANLDGFGEADFAEMAEMRVAVKLIPLFSGRVEIDEFVLVDPVIRLEQRGAGNNWSFAAEDTAAPSPASQTSGAFIRQPGALPIETSFGDVRIENASVSWSDGIERREITGLDMAVQLTSVDDPVQLRGSLNVDGQPLTFDADLGSLRGFFEGQETSLNLALGGDLMTARFDGRIPAGEDFAVDGYVETAIASMRELAAFAGTDLPPGEQLQNFDAAGALIYTPDRITLDDASVTLDAMTGTGNLSVDLSGMRPNISGQLDIPLLDVNPYLPADDETTSPDTNTPLAPWSEEEIDLAGLRVVDADIRITSDQLKFRDIEIADSLLRLRIVRGRMSANLNRFALYGGTGSARVVANGRGRSASYSLTAQLDSLDALGFLTAAAGFDRLQGTGGLNFEMLASGNNPAELMNSLSGTGNFGFLDGAIVGVNIAETIRTVEASIASRSLPSSFGEGEQTDFSSLAGSFSITGGQAANRDFLLLSPLLRVDGAGGVDLANQTLDYRLRPRAVASLQGQGGDRDMQGIVIPIRLRGRFDDISVGIDTEAVTRSLLTGALGNALGLDTSGGDEEEEASTEDLLRNGLLNALGLGRRNDSDDEENDGQD
jgi:AsmA protein